MKLWCILKAVCLVSVNESQVHMQNQVFPFVSYKPKNHFALAEKEQQLQGEKSLSTEEMEGGRPHSITHTDWQVISGCQERCSNTTATIDSHHRWWQQKIN